MTNRLDNKGFFVLEKHTRTKLRFAEYEQLEIRASYAGVIIAGMKIESTILEGSKKPGWKVSMDSSTEFELKLTCSTIEVLEAVPDLQKN